MPPSSAPRRTEVTIPGLVPAVSRAQADPSFVWTFSATMIRESKQHRVGTLGLVVLSAMAMILVAAATENDANLGAAQGDAAGGTRPAAGELAQVRSPAHARAAIGPARAGPPPLRAGSRPAGPVPVGPAALPRLARQPARESPERAGRQAAGRADGPGSQVDRASGRCRRPTRRRSCVCSSPGNTPPSRWRPPTRSGRSSTRISGHGSSRPSRSMPAAKRCSGSGRI